MSKTYKDRIQVFSQTPVVTKDPFFCYYGDYSNRPSTETISHWTIHHELAAKGDPRHKFIVHIHNDQMTSISESADADITVGSLVIPSVPHSPYGSEELGRKIIACLNERGAWAVSVQAHGQWFIGQDLEEMSQDIVQILRQLSSSYGCQRPKAFVSHCGLTTALEKLQRFLTDLGIDPLVVMQEPSLDRSVNRKVRDCIKAADIVIFLATVVSPRVGDSGIGANVVHEIGLDQAIEKHNGRRIYLLENGAEFPSNIGEKIYIRFDREHIESVFPQIRREIERMVFAVSRKKTGRISGTA